MHRLREIFILYALIGNKICLLEKTHFSRWIKTDSEYPKEIFIFEYILNKGIDYCIDSCKAKSMCKYINFHVNADLCSLIGVANSNETGLYDDKIETKKGYIFGRKQDWNMVIR